MSQSRKRRGVQRADEFDRALRGERKVFCLVCDREYVALNATLPGGAFRVIWPMSHYDATGFLVCSGSYAQALLEPRS